MARQAFSRRSFMAGLAGISGAVVLAACSQPPAAPAKPAESKPADAAKPAAPAAPAQQTAAAAKPAAPTQSKVTVRLHERANNVVQGGAQYELFKPGGHLDKFKEANPNVEVVVEPLPPGTAEYGPKLLSLHMGGTIGDVVYGAVGSGSFQYVAANEMVYPLDDFVKGENFDLKQYLPNMVDALRVSDKGIGSGPLYGLPLLVHARDTVLFYNKAMFDQAGVKYPDGDTMSLEDLTQIAKGLVKKSSDGRVEQYGLIPVSDGTGSRGYLQFVCMVRAFGGELISEDGKKALFNSPEAKATWKYFWDLQYTHEVMPPLSAGQAVEVFMSGRVAMTTSAGNVAYTFDQKKDLNYGVTPMPKGPSGKRGSMYMGDAYLIPSLSKQKEAGWNLLKWMTNKESGVSMCGIGLCGARQDVYDDPRVKSNERQALFNRLVAEALPFRGPANLRQVEVNDVTHQVTSALWTGNAKADDAFANDANAKIQQVLDRPRL
ncbi:MAG: extracellular solute-binding protein [Chloroflexi bacterium]|nr:extracellular solute-binding protein [Chloroflexota bacterium]